MSGYQIFTQPSQQALDIAASVLAGATLTFSLTGTSTPTNAFSDSALTTPVTNPLAANAAGVWIPIFLDPAVSYRIVLKSAAGAVLQTWDPANENLLSYILASLTQSVLGAILYPRTAAEIAAGVTPVNYAYPPGNALRYGATGDGVTNDTLAIQRAIDSLPSTGGDILFPAGGNYVIATSLNLADKKSIRLLGVGSAAGGTTQSAVLKFTATSGTRLIDCRSSLGVTIENLQILQAGVGFAGHVIDYSWSALVSDAFMGAVRNCYIEGVSTALSLVNLAKAHSFTIENNHFVNGICAILGGGADYANRINIVGNTFRTQQTAPIMNPGPASQAWLVQGNTFEAAATGKAAALSSTTTVTGLVFACNWCGDGNTTGTWIDVNSMDGCAIFANMISSGATGINFSGAASNDGIAIFGNTFSSITTAVNVSAATQWRGEYVNNFYLTVTNGLVGTPTGGRWQTLNGGIVTHGTAQQFTNTVANGIGGTLSGVIWAVLTGNAGNIGAAIKGFAAQSANLQEWRDSSDVALAAIGPTGYLEMLEQSAPTSPGANRARIFAVDNGSGKTLVQVRFAGGGLVTIATEP